MSATDCDGCEPDMVYHGLTCPLSGELPGQPREDTMPTMKKYPTAHDIEALAKLVEAVTEYDEAEWPREFMDRVTTVFEAYVSQFEEAAE